MLIQWVQTLGGSNPPLRAPFSVAAGHPVRILDGELGVSTVLATDAYMNGLPDITVWERRQQWQKTP